MTPNQPCSRAGRAAPYLALCAAAACGGVPRADERPPVAAAAPAARCRPGQPCWPTDAEWRALAAQLHGRLEPVHTPLDACRTDRASDACTAELAAVKNPFYLQAQTCSGGPATPTRSTSTSTPTARAGSRSTASDRSVELRS
jgi:hypothetical protein